MLVPRFTQIFNNESFILSDEGHSLWICVYFFDSMRRVAHIPGVTVSSSLYICGRELLANFTRLLCPPLTGTPWRYLAAGARIQKSIFRWCNTSKVVFNFHYGVTDPPPLSSASEQVKGSVPAQMEETGTFVFCSSERGNGSHPVLDSDPGS